MAETVKIDNFKLLKIFFPEELITEEEHEEHDKDFRLPIRWDGGDFYKELYLLLKEYRIRIENRLSGDEYAEYREDIKKVCQKVCLAVSESLRGNPHEAYNAVDVVLKLLTNKYPCYLGKKELQNCPLYRAVDVKDKAKHDRKRVFHVPFNLRSRMSTTRYSIPGYPALYLGTSLALNCEEIHKSPTDDTVMAAKFVLNTNIEEDFLMQFYKALYILDLSVKPQDFQRVHNIRNSSRLELPITHILRKRPDCYILWYPLIAACSFIRVYREAPYSAEYVIPQLVTQWAKKMEAPQKNDIFQPLCGVCYFSCLSEKASEEGLNFAFPSSGNDIWAFDDLKNFCPILAVNFKLTDPVFISEYKSPEDCENALKLLKTAQVGNFNRDTIKDEIVKNGGKYKIPDGEDFIPGYTFANCDKLTAITIPDSVTSIGDWAFKDCTGLPSLTIPDNVTSIGDWAFKGCTGLPNLIIPNSVMSIGNWAFSNCTGLPSLTIPDSVISIGMGMTSGCTKLCNITVCKENNRYYDKNNCIIEKNTGGLICGCKESIIPCDGSVTSIGNAVFEGCTGLTNLTIPDSVTSIGNAAFCDCTGLLSLNMSKNVTSIGDGALYRCIKLINFTIPYSVTSIGDYAFSECTGLSSLTIPNSVTSIGKAAFSNCIGLSNFTIPNSVKSIGDDTFNSCTGLKSITIPNSVKSIGDSAFNNCIELTNVFIPDSVTSIGDYTFSNCVRLKNLTLPNSLMSIGNGTFFGCTELIDLNIPKGVTSIGNNAFSNCTQLTNLTLPDSITSIGDEAFSGCIGFTRLIIPNSVTSIGDRAFTDCIGLTKLTIPDSVTSIGNRAFYNCKNLEIHVPSRFMNLSKFTFFGCKSVIYD